VLFIARQSSRRAFFSCVYQRVFISIRMNHTEASHPMASFAVFPIECMEFNGLTRTQSSWWRSVTSVSGARCSGQRREQERFIHLRIKKYPTCTRMTIFRKLAVTAPSVHEILLQCTKYIPFIVYLRERQSNTNQALWH